MIDIVNNATQAGGLVLWGRLVAWCVLVHGRVMDAWCVLVHGRVMDAREGVYLRTGLIPGEMLAVSPALACEVGLHEAIILQKVHEWCAFNEARNSKRHYTAGRWWMYMSYAQWHGQHLTFVSEATVRRKIKKLVDMGLLLTIDAGEITAQTWYSVNEVAVRALLGLDLVDEARVQVGASTAQNDVDSAQNDEGGVQFDTPTNNKHNTQNTMTKPKKQTNKTRPRPNGTARGVSAKFAQAGGDSVVVVKNSEIGGIDAVKKVCDAVRGMTETVAGDLLREYSEGRVLAVAEYARVQTGLRNPAGFVVSELRDNRLGLGEHVADSGSDRYTGGKYADFIES